MLDDTASLQGTIPALNANDPSAASSGGSTATPPPMDTSGLAALLSRIPAQPDANAPPADGLPAAPLSPAPLTAAPIPAIPGAGLPPPGADPLHHMSLATALNLAYNPGALQLLAHTQQMQHNANQERLQNMSFNEMMKEHARQAQEHADTVKNAQAEFESRLYAQGAEKMPDAFTPPAGDKHQYIHAAGGTYRLPTMEERAQQAREAKAKDTVEVPDPNDPTGKNKVDLPVDKLPEYMHAATEAKKNAASNGEDVETKTINKDDGHQYYQIVGKSSGKIYHETDAGKAMTGEREGDAKAKAREAAQARVDKRNDAINGKLTDFQKKVNDAKALNDTQAEVDTDFQNSERAWNAAKEAYYGGLKTLDPSKAGDKQQIAELQKQMDTALKDMIAAKGKTELTSKARARAWGDARAAHAGLHRYQDVLSLGGLGPNDEPTADWKEGAGPGAKVNDSDAGGGTSGTAGTGASGGSAPTPAAPTPSTFPAANLGNFVRQFGAKYGVKTPEEARAFLQSQGVQVQ